MLFSNRSQAYQTRPVARDACRHLPRNLMADSCCNSAVTVNGAVPYFLLCEALQNLEDGWASIRVMTTCRQARDSAAGVATNLRAARPTLLDMMEYLQSQCPCLPGFLIGDRLDIAMLRPHTWDPPVHVRILLRPIAFMEDAFAFGSQGCMRRWIDHYPEYRGLGPLDVLCAMKPSHQSCQPFQNFIAVLKEADARFFYSPITYRTDVPMEEQLPPSPGLVIAMRYQNFPLMLCARFSHAHYLETVYAPWFLHVLNQYGMP